VFDNTYALRSKANAYTPSGLALFVRPGVEELLQTLTSKGWRIIFWSSAMRQTLDAIRKELFPYIAPLTVMSHENSPSDERHPVVRAGKNWSILKDLRLLWRVPAMRCGCTNTVIVDDSWSKIRLQTENAVIVPSFEVNVRDGSVSTEQVQRELTIVGKIKDLLLSMTHADDVRQTLRDHANRVQYIRMGNFKREPKFKRVAAISSQYDEAHVRVRIAPDEVSADDQD